MFDPLQAKRAVIDEFRYPNHLRLSALYGQNVVTPNKPIPAPQSAEALPQGPTPGSIQRFIDALGTFDRKLHFKDAPDIWQAQYVIPTAEDELAWRNAAKAAHAYTPSVVGAEEYAEGSPINSSKESIQNWVSKLICDISRFRTDRTSGRPPVQIISGDIGSGKSTCIKYISKTYAGDFSKNKIVISRIEFQKMREQVRPKSHISEAENYQGSVKEKKTLIKQYISWAILRDIVHYRMLHKCDSVCKSPECDQSKSDMFTYIKNFYVLNNTMSSEQFSEYFDIISRYMWNNDDDGIKLIPPQVIELIIKYVQKNYGIDYIVAFDGLDAIRIDELTLKDEYRSFVQAISEIIGEGDSFLQTMTGPGQRLYANYVLVMRTSTHSYFTSNMLGALGKVAVEHFYVIPPSVKSIVIRRLERSKEGWMSLKSDESSFINEVHKNITRIFEGMIDRHTKSGFIYVFSGNCRNILRYYKIHANSILSHLSIDTSTINDTSEIESRFDQAARLVYPEREALLTGGIGYFKNYCMINPNPSGTYRDKKKLAFVEQFGEPTEENPKTSFIDNIFNYYMDDQITTKHPPRLLLNIRICQLLIKWAGQTVNGLKQKLSIYFGHRLDEVSISALLDILTRANIVTCAKHRRHLEYYVTPTGYYIVTDMIYDMTYLEHVVHQTPLPEYISNYIYVLRKYPDGYRDWPWASIRNCYVLMRWIITIERAEYALCSAKGLMDTEMPNWRISERLSRNLYETVNKMIGDHLDWQRWDTALLFKAYAAIIKGAKPPLDRIS